MRVLMTTDTIGGVWTYTRELATGLLQSGCDLTIISLGQMPTPEQEDWVETTYRRWPLSFRFIPTNYKLEWMENSALCYEESRAFFLRCIRRYAPDIVHTNQFCYGALAVGIPKVVVAHSDLLSWWNSCHGGPPSPSEWIEKYFRIVTNGLRGADVVVTPTAWMLYQIQLFYHPLRSAAVIANGRQIDSISFPRRRKLQAVTAGRLWDQAKNVRILSEIEAPFPVYLAGDLTFGGATFHPEEAGGLRLVGALREEELLRLFSESAIYIVPSLYEPFGLSAVEAAISGCAIIANDIPSLREVWQDAAIYFQTNNADSLSHILEWLSENPNALRTAARKAQARARQCFSRERMTHEYLELYRQLLNTETRKNVA